MKQSIAISVFTIAAAGLIVYAGSLENDFCYDENIVILANRHVQEEGQALNILGGTYWGSAAEDQEVESWGYRPLTILSYCVTRKLAGNDPFWFHFFNVLLHVAVSLLLFVFLVRLELPAAMAFLASGIFVLHAVHTEAVAQIVGRSELIAACFVLTALILHLETFEGGGRKKIVFSLLAALSCFIGLLGKENAASFIIAALCVDLLRFGREKSLRDAIKSIAAARWKVYLVYILPVLLFVVIRHQLFGRPFPTFDVHLVDNPLVALPFYLRPLGAIAVFGKVLALLILPVSLSADYGYNQVPVDRFYTFAAFYFGLLAAVAVTAAVIRYRRAAPFAFFGWLLFVLVYLPVSNVLFLIHTILGERILYIPSIGFCVFLAALLHRGALSLRYSVKIVSLSLICLLAGFHFLRTPMRNADWKNDGTLFEKTVRVSGNSIRVLNNYGNVLLMRGDLEGAEEKYRKALGIYPEYDDAAVNLSALLIRKGKADEAIELLDGVLERRPDYASARENYDLALELKKRE